MTENETIGAGGTDGLQAKCIRGFASKISSK